MGKEDLLKQFGVKVDEALEFWGDMEAYSDSLKEYLDTLEDKFKDLEKYKNTDDFENYGILAHSLKSEAKYLGFIKEADVFLQHELAGKNQDRNYINEHFNDLDNTMKAIKDVLMKYFQDGGSVNKKILVADDSNIILNYITKNISSQFDVVRAMTGNDAIEAIKNNDLYAIFLDLNMPLGNGFQVLEHLNDNNLLEKIPVIIITGDDTQDTIKKAFTYPILDVLNKPFDDENIKRILAAIHAFYEKNS